MDFVPRKVFAVYMMTNAPRGVFYVGVTAKLVQRTRQHRSGVTDGFTKKYRLKRLVWFRHFADALEAIKFEKQLKRWRREWKIRLIEEANPTWRDLWPEINGELEVDGPLTNFIPNEWEIVTR